MTNKQVETCSATFGQKDTYALTQKNSRCLVVSRFVNRCQSWQCSFAFNSLHNKRWKLIRCQEKAKVLSHLQKANSEKKGWWEIKEKSFTTGFHGMISLYRWLRTLITHFSRVSLPHFTLAGKCCLFLQRWKLVRLLPSRQEGRESSVFVPPWPYELMIDGGVAQWPELWELESVTHFTLHCYWRVSGSSPLAYLRERICELDIGAFLHCKDWRFASCAWPMVLRKPGNRWKWKDECWFHCIKKFL